MEQATDGSVVVVCASINSTVVVVQLRAGRVEELRRWDVGEPVFAEPVAVGGEIMMVTVKGKKLLLNLENMILKEAMLDVKGLVYAKPLVVSTTEAVLTTTEGEVLRVDLTTNAVMEASAMWQGDANVPTSDGEGNVYRVFFFWERVLRRGRKGRCGVFLQRCDFFKSDSPR